VNYVKHKKITNLGNVSMILTNDKKNPKKISIQGFKPHFGHTNIDADIVIEY